MTRFHNPKFSVHGFMIPYGLSQSELTPGGQRLYSAGDVRRLALIKQLTERCHAIGSVAPLSMAQLQSVAATHA